MPQPSPYSSTDSAEQKAIATFNATINPHYVKGDIRSRDKFPNVDGTLEIVNKDQVPLGKLDVQIRKIPKDATKYSCPATLAAYSGVSTLPLILVCVDTDNKRCYWRAITPTMPEYKPDQQTFTVRFQDPGDVIDPEEVYIEKWAQLVQDYQERISQYPTLRKELASRLSLENVPVEVCEFFQRYIDEVNSLFDKDFVAVKKLLLGDVWKLGVGIHSFNEVRVSYVTYKILYGEPSPLVCSVEDDAFDFSRRDPNRVSVNVRSRVSLGPPRTAASEYVLGHVRKVVEQRRFPIHGEFIATEVVFAFSARHSHLLRVDPNASQYSLDELREGMEVHLPRFCRQYLSGISSLDRSAIHGVDFDSISRFARSERSLPQSVEGEPLQTRVIDDSGKLNALRDAIMYLEANEVRHVARPFPSPIRLLLDSAGSFSSSLTEDEEIDIVRRVLDHSLDEYAAFARGNRLCFPDSPYLDRHACLHYRYQRGPGGFPWLSEFVLRDLAHCLPRVSVCFCDQPAQGIEIRDDPFAVTIDGREYCASECRSSDASFLFRPTPTLNMAYRMLSVDLERHYPTGHVSVGLD